MKAHIVWFCIAVTALVVGVRFARRETKVVEKPVEIAKTRETIAPEPAGVTPQKPPEGERIAERNTPAVPLATHNTPEEKAKAHQRYDSFLTQRGLTPAQIDRFVELKLAIADAQHDLQTAVEHNGAQGGTEGVEALRASLTHPMWAEIRQLLGNDGFKAYADYEQTSAYRPMVAGLFRASGVSASEQQVDQIAQFAINHTQTYRAKPTDIGTEIEIDWNAVAREAAPILTPAQVAAIRAEAARESSRLTSR